nr:MAG TPA_asm: hypothetical protein [Bacteriophage sp.]
MYAFLIRFTTGLNATEDSLIKLINTCTSSPF